MKTSTLLAFLAFEFGGLFITLLGLLLILSNNCIISYAGTIIISAGIAIILWFTINYDHFKNICGEDIK